MCLVAGGVFTQNLQNKFDLHIPTLQLTFMYVPLMCYLCVWIRDKRRADDQSEFIPIRYFLLCSLVDVHATLLIVFSFYHAQITSVMLLEDSTIVFAVILSLTVLHVRYNCWPHYVAILLCIAGMSVSVTNDLVVKQHDEGADSKRTFADQLLGDAMALGGSFLYALGNILQEKFLKQQRDVLHYLGFLGLFGFVITLIESACFGEITQFLDKLRQQDEEQLLTIWLNMGGFMLFNFTCYSIIPYFV